MSRKKRSAPPDPDGPRTYKFRFANPITIRIHDEPQITENGKAFRFELATPDGPALMTYEEFIRFAQTIAVLLNPRALLE